MNIRLLNLILLAGFVIFCKPILAGAKIEHWQTSHGTRVYFVQADVLPMVDIQVVFDAGSSRDGTQFGVSALTSSMMNTGAGQWTTDQLAQRFESVGAQFGPSVTNDSAAVSLRSLTAKPLLNKALETLQVILAQPGFNDADFLREKNQALAGLKQIEESPADLAHIAFDKALYGDHPYAHPTAGTLNTVSELTVTDIRNFYRKYYVASNAVVAMVGNLSRAQAEQTAEMLMSGLPIGQKAEPIPEVMMPLKASEQHIEFPSTQTHVLVGLPGTYRKDPDYFSLYVGNHILGGGGLVSKLFEEVREKRGLAYSANSSFIPMFRKGPFTVSLQTRNDQTGQALAVLNKTLSDFIAQGPTDNELFATKKNIINGFPMRFDTNRELIIYVSMIGFYGMPLDYLDTFQQNIDQVTIASIKDAFKRRIDPQLMQTVTVGQSNKPREK